MLEHGNPDIRALSYDEVPRLIWDSIRSDPDFVNVNFANIGPYQALSTPVIAWRGMGFKPGNTYAKVGHRETLKARQIYEIPSRDGRYMIQVYAQKHTGEIQFDCVDANSESAYRLMDRFQNSIQSALPTIKRNGVQELVPLGMSPEWMFERKGGGQLYVKPFKYSFVWDRKTIVAVPRIMDIHAVGTSLLRQIDLAVVRGTESYDILEQSGINDIDFALDAPYLSQETVTSRETLPDEWNPYIKDVDFSFSILDDGTTKVEWFHNRHIPQTGATYYITYWYSQVTSP